MCTYIKLVLQVPNLLQGLLELGAACVGRIGTVAVMPLFKMSRTASMLFFGPIVSVFGKAFELPMTPMPSRGAAMLGSLSIDLNGHQLT